MPRPCHEPWFLQPDAADNPLTFLSPGVTVSHAAAIGVSRGLGASCPRTADGATGTHNGCPCHEVSTQSEIQALQGLGNVVFCPFNIEGEACDITSGGGGIVIQDEDTTFVCADETLNSCRMACYANRNHFMVRRGFSIIGKGWTLEGSKRISLETQLYATLYVDGPTFYR